MSRTRFPLLKCLWLQEVTLMILSGLRSYKEPNDINQLTTSSLAQLWDDVLFSFTPEKGATLLRLQGKHSPRHLRGALLGDWKAPERWVTATRYWDASGGGPYSFLVSL